MIKILRKILRSIGIIVLVILTGAYIVNPDQIFRLSPKRHELVNLEKQETEHITMYGGDAEFAEEVYTQLQTMFGAFYINKRVKIYTAKPAAGTEIGSYHGTNYAGIYRRGRLGFSNVIIYNGNKKTLVHELAHFFTLNMKKNHLSEYVSRLIPRVGQQGEEYNRLIRKHNELKIRFKAVSMQYNYMVGNYLKRLSVSDKQRIINGQKTRTKRPKQASQRIQA